ncbi:flagellar assembly peptidoglycan hydrolase FlgJ [Edwardsiella tarda]|uniref:flagellar assembly peptidoglycan hydrolase FlgJ n=1 Tax=Edwardsiella tarda TaxID=636 RepID=UPI00351C960B
MADDSLAFSSAAYDAQALNSLKYSAASGSDKALRETARQMEGMFLQMMLKSMRQATPQEGLLDSEQSRLYTSLYDQQVAQEMAAGKGMGIADMLYKQMRVAHHPQSAIPDSVGVVPMALDGETINSMPVRALEQVMRRAMPRIPQTGSALPLPNSNGEFMAQLSLPAQLASRQSGIPHQLIMAQAALESGWGQREIPMAHGGRSYNLFGIKAGKNWEGPTTEVTTTEYENGVAVKTRARFRVYGSYFEAINDYIGLLTNNPRYAAVVNADTPEQAAHALQRAGYATDPHYANKLVQLIGQIKQAGQRVVQAYTHDLANLF